MVYKINQRADRDIVSTGLIPRAAFMVSHESRATGLGMTGSRTRRLYTHSARLVETGTGARSFMACGGRVGRSMVWHVHKHKFPQFCAAWPGGRSVETFFPRLHVHRSVRLVETNVDTRIESGGISKPCISDIRSIPFSMRPSGHSTNLKELDLSHCGLDGACRVCSTHP